MKAGPHPPHAVDLSPLIVKFAIAIEKSHVFMLSPTSFKQPCSDQHSYMYLVRELLAGSKVVSPDRQFLAGGQLTPALGSRQHTTW